jgi:phospholipase C
VIGDFDAYLDDCGGDAGGTNTGTTTLEMTGKNVGDLLNAKGVSWGWFQGGFRPTTPSVNGSVAQCHDGRVPHQYPSVNPTVVVPNPVPPFLTGSDIHTPATSPTNYDYVSHHSPFQFYASTRNSHHLPPSSVAAIGQQDQANHLYDTRDFFAALSSGNLPAVSFVKAPSAYNGHPGNSDPTVEQYWLTQVINAIQQSKEWASTAIILAYDDSDGWYDHVTGPIVSPSQTSLDVYSSHGCGNAVGAALAIPARCGYGPRLPLLVISPWANPNYVDHTLTNQASILKFIEDNWSLGRIDATELPPGAGSFDRTSGSLLGLFNFNAPPSKRPVLLTCSGNYVINKHGACELDPSQMP